MQTTSPLVANSLLRIDSVTAPLPAPFEHPRTDLDFAVLELGQHADTASWCDHVVRALSSHAAVLREAQRRGSQVTLFVESASATPFTFDPALLRVLADSGIALEHSHTGI
jgi:hypothetical protein